jgi:hypothetical protein
VIQIAPQMRILVALEAVDGRTAGGEPRELRKYRARAYVLVSSLPRCEASKDIFAIGGGSSRQRKWSSSGN